MGMIINLGGTGHNTAARSFGTIVPCAKYRSVTRTDTNPSQSYYTKTVNIRKDSASSYVTIAPNETVDISTYSQIEILANYNTAAWTWAGVTLEFS